MPCTHMDFKIIQRSKGMSAVASAAYQIGGKLYSVLDAETKDHTTKEEVIHTEIMLPPNAPPEFQDRETLWNSVELNEKQWDAQFARKFVICLPIEVPADQHLDMVREYCRENFLSKGMIVDFALHDKPGNPHAHIMLTMRSLDEQGRWMPKCKKEYVLDENGERIRLPSGRWKSRKVNVNDWNDRGNAKKWRMAWGDVQNKYLQKNNRPERVDMRSYKEQGIDQIPTIHLGNAAFSMEQKGIPTMLGTLNRDIEKANAMVRKLKQLISDLTGWIDNLKSAIDALKEELEQDERIPTVSEFLMEYLVDRKQGREGWAANPKNKQTVKDLKNVTELQNYLTANHIVSMDDLNEKLTSIESQTSALSARKRQIQKRMTDIKAVLTARADLKTYQPIHDQYQKKGFKLTKEKFANSTRMNSKSTTRLSGF